MQAGNEWSNILPKSLQVRKKPPPPLGAIILPAVTPVALSFSLATQLNSYCHLYGEVILFLAGGIVTQHSIILYSSRREIKVVVRSQSKALPKIELCTYSILTIQSKKQKNTYSLSLSLIVDTLLHIMYQYRYQWKWNLNICFNGSFCKPWTVKLLILNRIICMQLLPSEVKNKC